MSKKTVQFNDSVTVHKIENVKSNLEYGSMYEYEYSDLEGDEYEEEEEESENSFWEMDDTNNKQSYFDAVCSGTYSDTTKSDKEAEKKAEDMVTLINTFLKFYKVHYENESENNSSYYMFQGIKESDGIGSTNRCMEMFQKYIDEYYENRNDDYSSSIFEIDDLDFDFSKKKSYILNINNKADKVSHTLLVLLKYVASIKVQDWIIDVMNV